MLLVQGNRAHDQAVNRQAPAGPSSIERHSRPEGRANMNSNHKTSTKGAQGRARGAGRARETAGRARREKAAGAGSSFVLGIAVIVAVLPVLGCGNHKSERAAAGSGGGPSATVEPYVSVVPASTEGMRAQGSDSEAVPADSLPPDVTASASETLAFPGNTVEITARASADVVEVVLWDGIGRRQSFAYDTTAGVWRASYRVPLGISRDRLGLSVTAKNGRELRDRVWVFLQIQREAPAEPEVAQPDSQPQSGL